MNKLALILRESRTARFLIPVGLILIIFGIVFFTVSKQNQNFVKTEATVVKAEMDEVIDEKDRKNATYTVEIKYTVDGKEYEGELSGVSKYEPGDKMTIYYDPDDPAKITQTKSLIIPLVMVAVGIAALAGGGVSASNAIKRYQRMKEQEKEWTHG